MTKLEMFKAGFVRLGSRQLLIAKKYSPEILLAIGIGTGLAATYKACKATLKAVEVKEEINNNLSLIDEVRGTATKEEYSDSDYVKDKTIVYIQGGIKMAKLYGPAIALGTISLGCILGNYKIMRGRNVALMAAYKVVDEGFKNYRARVIEEYGEEKDHQFKRGIRAEEITVEKEMPNGKKKTVKEKVNMIDPNKVSKYARFFDKYCSEWSPEPEFNLLLLKQKQNYANDLLHARGHIFLNEVYDMLGMERSKEGAVVGWVVGKNGYGDKYVDFGIYDIGRETSHRFVNGLEPTILLDFNVAGLIYDKI